MQYKVQVTEINDQFEEFLDERVNSLDEAIRLVRESIERGDWHGIDESGTLTVIVSIYVGDDFFDNFVDCQEIEATYTNGSD